MLHGLLDKGIFKQAKVFLWLTTLFLTWCTVLVLDVRLWNRVSTQIWNRTADHQGYNTPFSVSDYVPLQYGPLRKNRIKAEHRNSVFQGCCWELAHTVVQMHRLSCNTHYCTGTWGSLNDFDFLDDTHWNIPMYFMLSWKALLVSCILCRILAASNHYNWPYNGPMAIAENPRTRTLSCWNKTVPKHTKLYLRTTCFLIIFRHECFLRYVKKIDKSLF